MLDVLTPLSDCRHETVEKIMERRISGVSYMCRIDFHNGIWGCGLSCTLLITFYFLPLFLLLFHGYHAEGYHAPSLYHRLPRRGLPRPIYISPATTPRATTPHLYRTGHHAFTTTAQLSRLCISRLPRQGLPRPILTTTGYHACVFIQVITPELSRSTIHVHRVITPAISNSYFVVFISPAFTPPLPTYSAWRTPHEPTQHASERFEQQ